MALAERKCLLNGRGWRHNCLVLGLLTSATLTPEPTYV